VRFREHGEGLHRTHETSACPSTTHPIALRTNSCAPNTIFTDTFCTNTTKAHAKTDPSTNAKPDPSTDAKPDAETNATSHASADA
jgi:hypothetical protein